MKRFSAQYIITNSGPILKRGIISADNDGTIINIEETGGDLTEKGSVEFYNGIIIPGFVNCHCHIELSFLKGLIPRKTGLPEFIKNVRESRGLNRDNISRSITDADKEMSQQGTVICADIANTTDSFEVKTTSKIKYISLLEVFGIDHEKAAKRIEEISGILKTAKTMGLDAWMVPHSVYALSLPLFRLLKEITASNRITSIHFMESEEEKNLLKFHGGLLMKSYIESGLIKGELFPVKDHVSAILDEITSSGNLILVHNTYAERDTIRNVKSRKNLFWCLCPNSNIFIENNLPPVNLLIDEKCEIILGTDSLASNSQLGILEEMKTLQEKFPFLSLEVLVKWATINGARALGQNEKFGSIEPGKKPGLILLKDVGLESMKLFPETYIKRLI